MENKVEKLYWSRAPGKFVNKYTGQETLLFGKKTELQQINEYEVPNTNPKIVVKVFQEQIVDKKQEGPIFFGTVREWYETLAETIFDAGSLLEHRTQHKATEVIVGPDVLSILENLISYKADYKMDRHENLKPGKLSDRQNEPVGTLSNRFNVFKNYDIPRNEIYVKVIDPKTNEAMDKLTVEVLDLGLI